MNTKIEKPLGIYACRVGLSFGLSIGLVAFAGSSLQEASFTIDRGAIVRGSTDQPRIALEFTGDQFAEGATAILEALKAREVKASFFVTGRFLRNPAFRDVIVRIRQEGHFLGPHSDQHVLYASWDQPPRLLVTQAQFKTDMRANMRELARLGLASAQARFFLPPYEHYTEEIARWAGEEGLKLFDHTPGTRSHTDYMEDQDPHFQSAASIFDSIVKAEQNDPHGLNGYLLLMHLGAGPKRTRDHPYERLGALLDRLHARGYQLVRVDELLAARP